jgi:hypothetical protein
VAGIQSRPAAPAPLPSHIIHPIDGKRVALTPELVARLEKEEPALMASIRDRAARDAERAAGKGPVHYHDASHLAQV